MAEPVKSFFRWRPQLRDPGDEMVLEAAVKLGKPTPSSPSTKATCAKRGVTSELKSFAPPNP